MLTVFPQTGHADTSPGVEPPVITAIRINIINHPDPGGEIRHLAETRLQLKKGDSFSPHLLEQSIVALRRTGRFESIHADSNADKKQVELQFNLRPYPLIKQIRIKNAFPVFHGDILKTLTLTTGDAMQSEQIPRQGQAVTELYRKQGFIAPIVDLTTHIDPTDGHGTLNIQVDKGPHFRLGQLTFSGNTSLSDYRLKLRMKTWRRSLALGVFGRFIESELKEDITALNQYYRKQKFAEARVGYKLEKMRDTRTINLVLEINEGPRYRFEFEGNEKISSHALKKDMAISILNNKRNRDLRKVRKTIESKYRQAGYLEASVTIDDESATENGRPVRLIRFNIHEGPRSVIQNVEIKGNRSIPAESLKANILTRPRKWNQDGSFSPDKLADDLQAIRFQYSEKGYLSPNVQADKSFNPTREKVDITFLVDEGLKTQVHQVTFNGLTAITRDQAINNLTLKPGAPFRDYMVGNDENVLKSLIAAQGYPQVKITGNVELSPDKTQTSIIYRIEEGPFVRRGEVFYQGNFKTRRKALDREWTLSKGAPLNPYRLLESENNIRNLDIINTAKSTPLGFTAKSTPLGFQDQNETVDMLLTVGERKPYFFELSGGYESDRRFFISTKLADRNFLGMNRLGWISSEVSEIGYRFESGIREPRLFGTRIATNFHGFYEHQEQFNQDFGIEKSGATLGFELTPTQRIATGLHIKYELLDLFEKDGADPSATPSEIEQEKLRNVLVGTPRIQFDSRDSFIRPRKGIFSLGDIDISRGLRNDLDDFLRYRLDFRFFWTPADALTFAIIGRGDILPLTANPATSPKTNCFTLGEMPIFAGLSKTPC